MLPKFVQTYYASRRKKTAITNTFNFDSVTKNGREPASFARTILPSECICSIWQFDLRLVAKQLRG